MLEIFTSRRYSGPSVLDVSTRAVGVGAIFAPPCEVAALYGEPGNAHGEWPFHVAYMTAMRASYRAHAATWATVLARRVVVLVCDCEDESRCHRRVIAEILQKCGGHYNGEIDIPTRPSRDEGDILDLAPWAGQNVPGARSFLATDDRPFVALDFEGADEKTDSACSLALIRVEGGRIVGEWSSLFRPPREWIKTRHVHGLSWMDLRDQPTFARAFPDALKLMDGVAYLVAHNASYDNRMLRGGCAAAGIEPPALPMFCTQALARAFWPGLPQRLNELATRFKIPLQHHQALSDAQACAKLVLRARLEHALRLQLIGGA